MGKVKRLELWWQLYLYVTAGSGLRKKPAITLCAFECTSPRKFCASFKTQWNWSTYYPVLLDLWKSIAFLDVRRLRPFVLLVTETCIWRSEEWHLTGERKSNVRTTCLGATLSTTVRHRGERRANNRLNYGIAPVKTKIKTESYLKIGSPELHLKIHFAPCSEKKTRFSIKKSNPSLS
jgi:hypothetical protein